MLAAMLSSTSCYTKTKMMGLLIIKLSIRTISIRIHCYN